MTRFTTVSVAIVFVALVFSVYAEPELTERDGVRVMRWDQFLDWFCKTNPAASWISICNSITMTTTDASTNRLSTTAERVEYTTSTSSESTSSSASLSERQRWCQFKNGTYLSLGYTFMHTQCALCQCTQSREIRCTNLQCMPTYCFDGSAPSPKPGQCCPQCAYEPRSTPCVINGVRFPHGTILRRTSDNVQCWCQLGNVECRKATNTLFSSLDYWGRGSSIYVVVIIICIILILGTLLCCSGTILFYYYYQRQQAVQQSYAEYYNNAGWQPMSEDGQVVDEKQAEAAQNPFENEYPNGNSEQYVPPPYAIYNGSYEHEKNSKDGK